MSRRRLFGSLCSMVFLVNFGRIVFAPLIEPLAVAFDVPPEALAPAASAAWFGSAMLRIPTGWLLTRVSRTRVVLGSGLVLAVASIAIAFAPTVPLLVVGAFLVGLASGAYFIAANPLVSELFPASVGRMLGVHGAAAQVAAVLAAPIVTGVLLVGDWQVTFFLLAAVALLTTLAFVLTARRTDLPEAGIEDRDLLGAARSQWRIVLVGVVIVGTAGFVWNGLFNLFVTYLKTARGLEESTARNLLLPVLFGAGIPAFAVSGRLADRLPRVPYLLAVVAGFVACLLVLTVTRGVLALVVVAAALGYAIHSLFPAIDAYLLGALPDHHRASAYSVYSGGMMPVQAMGSAALGALVSAGYAYDTVFRAFGGGLALVLAGLVAVYVLGWVPTGTTDDRE